MQIQQLCSLVVPEKFVQTLLNFVMNKLNRGNCFTAMEFPTKRNRSLSASVELRIIGERSGLNARFSGLSAPKIYEKVSLVSKYTTWLNRSERKTKVVSVGLWQSSDSQGLEVHWGARKNGDLTSTPSRSSSRNTTWWRWVKTFKSTTWRWRRTA